MTKRSLLNDDELKNGAESIAADMTLPDGRVLKLARVIDDHLDWFDKGTQPATHRACRSESGGCPGRDETIDRARPATVRQPVPIHHLSDRLEPKLPP